jgi:hypothetical protein
MHAVPPACEHQPLLSAVSASVTACHCLASLSRPLLHTLLSLYQSSYHSSSPVGTTPRSHPLPVVTMFFDWSSTEIQTLLIYCHVPSLPHAGITPCSSRGSCATDLLLTSSCSEFLTAAHPLCPMQASPPALQPGPALLGRPACSTSASPPQQPHRPLPLQLVSLWVCRRGSLAHRTLIASIPGCALPTSR